MMVSTSSSSQLLAKGTSTHVMVISPMLIIPGSRTRMPGESIQAPVTIFGTADLDVSDIDIATVQLCLDYDVSR